MHLVSEKLSPRETAPPPAPERSNSIPRPTRFHHQSLSLSSLYGGVFSGRLSYVSPALRHLLEHVSHFPRPRPRPLPLYSPTTSSFLQSCSSLPPFLAMETPPPPPASTRRVPPPCWTRDETVALIQAYRGKWFALGRGNLRAADWDAVADAVSPSAVLGTPKTAVQCRHKIEKMRKRFRAEKQRGLRRPGKFFSSWDLFPLLDAMNFASVGSGDHHDPDDSDDVKVTAVDGLRLKLANNGKLDRDYGLNLGFQDDFRAGYGSKYGFVDGDVEFNRKLGDGYDVKLSGNRNFVAHLANYGSNCKIGDSYTCAVDFDHSVAPGVGAVTGFPVKSLVDGSFLSSGFKSKDSFRTDEKFKTGFTSYVLPGGKTKDCNKLNEESRTDIDLGYNEEGDRVNAGGGAQRRVSADWDGARYGLHDAENYSGADEGFVGNGYASSSRFDAGKKSGVKRGSDVVGEMVLSIKFLPEVFMRMEKTKMEMVREIEKMRMDIWR